MKFPLTIILAVALKLQATVVPYNFPESFPVSERYQVKVDQHTIEPLQTERGAILNFGMSEPVEIQVALDQAPQDVVIRPLHAGIEARVEGRVLRFQLPRPMNLSVEVDGDISDPLLVFANPKELNAPSREDPKVKYYEAGKVHQEDEIFLEHGETLYLEPGAVVNAVVRAVDARNVSIRGAGILNAGYRKHKINQLVLRECVGARLENFIILDSFGWTIHLSGSEDIEIDNVRVVAWRANCDGLDIEYSSRVRVNNCFFRTYDDSIAVKALYPRGVAGVPLQEMIDPETLGKHDVPEIEGDVIGDILVRDSVFWTDGAQSLEIGFELRVDRIKGITFRNCDVIHARGGAAFSIHNGDRAIIEDIVLQDIRIENVKRLFDFHVGLSIYSDDCPEQFRRSNPNREPPSRRPEMANNPWQWFVPLDEHLPKYQDNRGLVRNVAVRSMTVLEKPKVPSILQGYSPERTIQDVTFINLKIAGEPVLSADDLDLYQKHTRNVRFLAPDDIALRFDPVIREIEGWTVLVEPKLLPGGAEAEVGKRALSMLQNHLERIAILLPEKQLAELRTCEIWLEYDHPSLGSMQYHPGEEWLIDNGHDPRLTKKVHITQAEDLLSRQQMLKHPAVILHELAHAYHDLILGFDEPRILKAYEQAMESGKYKESLLFTGDYVEHYGCTNHKEYFAESTEAYLYHNDFYPFVAAELNEHDSAAFELMADIWGTRND
ncbi:glycosyl hydrolase family 28 protein [Coraliomargarita sinensis]|nr:glycosyl hydrolase family 28 protein [Coraliomargarita sinensis]